MCEKEERKKSLGYRIKILSLVQRLFNTLLPFVSKQEPCRVYFAHASS